MDGMTPNYFRSAFFYCFSATLFCGRKNLQIAGIKPWSSCSSRDHPKGRHFFYPRLNLVNTGKVIRSMARLCTFWLLSWRQGVCSYWWKLVIWGWAPARQNQDFCRASQQGLTNICPRPDKKNSLRWLSLAINLTMAIHSTNRPVENCQNDNFNTFLLPGSQCHRSPFWKVCTFNSSLLFIVEIYFPKETGKIWLL